MMPLFHVTVQGSHRDTRFFVRAADEAAAEAIVRNSTLRVGEVQAVQAARVSEQSA